MSATDTIRLEDREAIRDVLTAYAHAVDRRQWQIMQHLFHPDAEFQFGTISGDWQNFVEQARGVIDPCIATQHQLGQILFGFESDTVCHTETYMTAMHTIPAGYPTPEVFPDKGKIYSAVIAGRYVDRMELRSGEWRIAKRIGLYDWREYREVEGVDMSELAEEARGYYDERDPSTPAASRYLI